MAYRLDPGRPLGAAVREIAAHQLERACGELDLEDPDEAVHEFRKRMKKLRALTRLVRPGLGKKVYKATNTAARDAAGALSDLRDAKVLGDTLRQLLDEVDDTVEPTAVEGVLALVDAAHRDLREQTLEAARDRARRCVGELAAALDAWELDDGDAAEVLHDALKKVYGRGREALARVERKPSAANLHELRKRAKYLRFHVHLLARVWKRPLDALDDEIEALESALGDDHDLAVLADVLAKLADEIDGETHTVLEALIARRRAEIQARALPRARRLYDEPDGAFATRLTSYVRLRWQEESVTA